MYCCIAIITHYYKIIIACYYELLCIQIIPHYYNIITYYYKSIITYHDILLQTHY